MCGLVSVSAGVCESVSVCGLEVCASVTVGKCVHLSVIVREVA